MKGMMLSSAVGRGGRGCDLTRHGGHRGDGNDGREFDTEPHLELDRKRVPPTDRRLVRILHAVSYLAS